MNKFKILVAGGLFLFFLLAVFFSFLLFSAGGFEFGNVIALIPLKGEITSENCVTGACTNYEEFGKMIKNAEKDPEVKAIVIDINSPGGEVFASMELNRIIKNCKKPVVAYIGEVGASGAYYAASAADEIIADEYSMTGSIGVKTVMIEYKGLLDKLGVNVTTIKKPENKDIGSPYKHADENETKEMQDIVDKIYDAFISDVAENRNISKQKIQEISEKKSIYFGSEAKEIGLIDKIGTKEDAIKSAADKAGIRGEIIVKDVETNTNKALDDFVVKIGYGIGKALMEEKNFKITSTQTQ